MSTPTPVPYTGDPSAQYVGPDVVGGPQPQTIAGPGTYAQVSVEEAIGPDQNTFVITQGYVHLLGTDAHSNQTLLGYTKSPLRFVPLVNTADPDSSASTTTPEQTFERWFRVRFDPPFNAIWGIRFWVPNYAPVPGWNILWGSTDTYQTPVDTPSAIAVNDLPTTDPGPAMPNCGGYHRLPGTGTQYSDWIVVQATADPDVAGVGPVLGFTAEGTLIPITFNINWIED